MCSVMAMINLRYPMPVNMDVIRCVLVGWLVVVVILLWWFRLGGNPAAVFKFVNVVGCSMLVVVNTRVS